MKILKYKASDGKEFFIEIVNEDDILFALLRLRIFGNNAIVRELHVYGKALEIGHHEKGISQHSGFGKKLMPKAEEITKNYGISKLKIISGVGVREYYKKLGYELEGTYMVKNLNEKYH
jgi:elongator complex protein 3